MDDEVGMVIQRADANRECMHVNLGGLALGGHCSGGTLARNTLKQQSSSKREDGEMVREFVAIYELVALSRQT